MKVNFDVIEDCLNSGDDPSFWRTVIDSLFNKPLDLIPVREEKSWPVYLMIGPCSRWLSAQPTRFSDTQGVPLPANSEKKAYSRLVMPDYDWSILYLFDEEKREWKFGTEPTANHYLYRVALPARTVNLSHATVLTHWEPVHPTRPEFSDYPQLYTFRKTEGSWEMVIRSVEA